VVADTAFGKRDDNPQGGDTAVFKVLPLVKTSF
jgi:hypothetical protein